MSDEVRGIRSLFVFLFVALPLASMLYFTPMHTSFSSRFAKTIDGRNASFRATGGPTPAKSVFRHRRFSQRATSPCYTVGFPFPNPRNGLGNHLFYYAGTLYVAWLTGRRPLILTSSTRMILDRAFNVSTTRLRKQNKCPVKRIRLRFAYGYDSTVGDLINVNSSVSIHVVAGFCSWRYTQPIEDQLRRELRFRPHLTTFAEKFLSSNVPHGWKASTFVRIGVHVRRRDFLSSWANARGFTVATEHYLYRAMTYFASRFQRVQFIVCSNDISWCLKKIHQSSFNRKLVNITFSIKHTTEEDLALLASCNHTVMSTGTFSWWASWLANGTTVYYKNFARYGSSLWRDSRAADYFPPTWIGLN